MNHAIPLSLVRTALAAKTVQLARRIAWPPFYGIGALSDRAHCHWINHRLANALAGRAH